MFTRNSVSILAFVALVVVVIGSALTLPTAKAYSTEGIRWQNNLEINYGMASMQSYDRQGFIDGMTAWNTSAAPVIFYGSSATEVAESDTNAGNSGWVGETTWTGVVYCNYPYGYTKLSYASTKLNIYYTQHETRATIQGDAAHELGHAIGLGHSSVTTALMYYAQNGTNSPQPDDINGASYIYAQSC